MLDAGPPSGFGNRLELTAEHRKGRETQQLYCVGRQEGQARTLALELPF